MQSQQKAPVTWTIIGLAILVQLCLTPLILAGMGITETEFYQRVGIVPSFFWEGRQPWALLSWLFLHDSWLQLIFAGLTLGTLGASLEKELGSIRFAWLYFVSGLCSALPIVFLSNSPYNSVATSYGALCGLLGMLLVFYPRTKLHVLIVPVPVWLIALVVLLFSITAYVANSDDYDSSYLLIYPTGLIGGVIYSILALKARPGGRFGRDLELLKMDSSPISPPAKSSNSSKTDRAGTAQYLQAMQQSGGITGKMPGESGKSPTSSSSPGPVSLKGRMGSTQKPAPLQFPDNKQEGSLPPESPAPTEQTAQIPQAPEQPDDSNTTPAAGQKLIFNPETGEFEYK